MYILNVAQLTSRVSPCRPKMSLSSLSFGWLHLYFISFFILSLNNHLDPFTRTVFTVFRSCSVAHTMWLGRFAKVVLISLPGRNCKLIIRQQKRCTESCCMYAATRPSCWSCHHTACAQWKTQPRWCTLLGNTDCTMFHTASSKSEMAVFTAGTDGRPLMISWKTAG